jgi:signal transduction histidine kinase
MRLLRVSLAIKYRILFGAAVLLIIGAALFVPWYRMEQLLLEQPHREAQRIVDDYFRLALGSTGMTPGGVHSREALIREASPAEPRFYPSPRDLPRNPEQIRELLSGESHPEFVRAAFVKFVRRPELDHVESELEGGRRLAYARAIRVSQSCLVCHDQGKTAKRAYRENELAGVISVDLPADPQGTNVLINRWAVIVAGSLAGFLAVLVFYLITHRFILSPIHELREVAIRVTEGDLDVRSTVKTGDEFQHLSDNLNMMLERLRASQDELRKANKLLDHKLGEMAETNVALYESNRVKSEFLANVTHELRTPLTSIIGFAELLREAPGGEQQGRTIRYAENILISGRILLEIINDLLDLAKIEAGKVELKLESLRVEELCSTLLDFMRPQADKKGLRLTLEAGTELPIVITDRGKLRQVLFNLLSNAIKFTPEGGSVTTRIARERDGMLRLEVADTGPGIAAEHQAIIFEKFRQIDSSTTREHPGTGLGLAIARELTTLLGGRIGVTGETGAGSTFWVELPMVTPEPGPKPLVSLV